MPRITISYRRADSGVITGRIFDRLVAQYGREAIFRDIDDVPFGVDFREHINRVLDDSDIVLAIIGPRWLGPRGAQNRLNSEADPVRVEIEIALKNGIPLIPVLLLRAQMPSAAQLPESPGPETPNKAPRWGGLGGGDVCVAAVATWKSGFAAASKRAPRRTHMRGRSALRLDDDGAGLRPSAASGARTSLREPAQPPL